METTEKQKQANRENGALGGVKTQNGKDISRKNAIKHGVLAHCSTKYDLIDLEDVYSELAGEFGDTSPSRCFLIQQLALTILRLARCSRAETEIIREALNPKIVKVRNPMILDFSRVEVISEGEPTTIPYDKLEQLELIYGRYEAVLLRRALKLIDALKRT